MYSGYVSSDMLQKLRENNVITDDKKTGQYIDLTASTGQCMAEMYAQTDFTSSESILHSAGEMFACWSFLSSYDMFPKSSDFAGKCPFHYNHWSCDGLRFGK